MKKLASVLAIATMTIGAGTAAFANGGSDRDFQQAELKAELAKQRAGQSKTDESAGLLDFLFGGTSEAEGKSETTKSTKEE